jgi:hypothetical protein
MTSSMGMTTAANPDFKLSDKDEEDEFEVFIVRINC